MKNNHDLTSCHAGKKLAKVIAITNQKGGVGKTTTTMNLGYSLSQQGFKVLLIDFDPQHNLTNYLEGEAHSFTISEAIAEEISGETEYVSSLIQKYTESLHYIPTNLSLSAIELKLVMTNAREYILTDILTNLKIRDQYDYVLIDCMPALNMLLINVITAVDSIIVPVEASYGAFEGLEQLFEYVKMVQKRLNRDLKIEGIVYTKVNNTKISKEVREKLQDIYPNLLLSIEIKELTEARKSYAERIPLEEMKKSRLAMDYSNLATEIAVKRGQG
ncbi:ParA family protein [Ruoffia tabacinasalis]|uniref:Sporulation initiation inhibitor protein Soj n=1 Tax=Ruoffia tabacinasalis TaxID=87458 RepID=A0A5R9EH16_9LACT|nr:AAA family ATPase [Ruoffia tabacinasalis]TLQ49480.1 ParA family protein [Ruoffia tabacinasalis]